MLSGKTALVTGSNRGIRKAILEKFLENGADVICAVRKIDDKFSSYINLQSKKFNKDIKVLKFDLKNEAAIKKSLEILYTKKTIVDILVNNAGVPGGSLTEMTSIKSLREIFEINFFLMRIFRYSMLFFEDIFNLEEISFKSFLPSE